MDIADEESGLIHSKFRKAKRQVSCQLIVENHKLHQVVAEKPSELSLSDHMYIESQPVDSGLLPNRVENNQFGGENKSPIFGTNNVSFGAISPHQQQSPQFPLLPAASGNIRGSSIPSHMPTGGSSSFPCEVFRFDSQDRERYLCSAISEEEEVFSCGPSPSSWSTRSYDSPRIVLDSPRITISPLRLQDSPTNSSFALTPSPIMDSQNRLIARVHTGLAMLPPSGTVEQSRCLFGVPSSPVSPLTPNTPLSPSPLFNTEHTFQQGFLAELYRRRCHSDSDLPLLPESPKVEPTDLSMKSMERSPSALLRRPRKQIPHPLTIPKKGGSLESDQSSPQDSPLDLSVKGSRERFGSSTSCESLTTTRFVSSLAIQQHRSPAQSPGVNVIRGDIASPTTRNSVALRYNLDVSPVVEEMPPGADMAFVCPICGQMFSLHDRLAKHMASRHKSKPHDPNKSYPCEICHRSFARSDMLTRHVRLHTGIKPYTCKVCGQVFSRSDHLSTHQRTHTGEKPYKCPQCPYSACRRDMITRHLRTHTRNSSSSSSSDLLGSVSTPTSITESFLDDRHFKIEHSRPPSSSSSFAPDSPSSPALHISSLSVNSPPPS